jgi:hypothetical protein
MVTDNFVLTLDSKQEYDWESGSLSEKSPDSSLLLKAYLQYFINGLINNNLSL